MSLVNFALGILVARNSDVRGLGAFGVLYATYVLLLGVNRSVFAEPFMIRIHHPPAVESRRPEGVRDAVCGGAGVLGLLAGLALLAASLVLPADFARYSRAFAVVLPGLLLQDGWRFILLAQRRPRRAAGMDLTWVALTAMAVLAVLVAGRASAASLVLAWGGAATLAAAIAIIRDGGLPMPVQGLRWAHRNRDLSLPFLAELSVLQGAGQATVYGIPAVAGLAAFGALKGAELLVGPINILSMGLMAVITPEMVRLRHRSLPQLRQALVLVGGAMALITLLWGLGILLLPAAWGRSLLGETWEDARSIVLAVVVLRAASELAQAAGRGLRTLEQARTCLRVQLTCFPFYVAAVLLGAWRAGALGAAVGGAMVASASVVLWWQQFGRALRVAGEDPSPHAPMPAARQSNAS